MIERNCRQAKVFAERLHKAVFAILNNVVLNQVLVSFGSAEDTRRVITDIQNDWDPADVEERGGAGIRRCESAWPDGPPPMRMSSGA